MCHYIIHCMWMTSLYGTVSFPVTTGSHCVWPKSLPLDFSRLDKCAVWISHVTKTNVKLIVTILKWSEMLLNHLLSGGVLLKCSMQSRYWCIHAKWKYLIRDQSHYTHAFIQTSEDISAALFTTSRCITPTPHLTAQHTLHMPPFTAYSLLFFSI